MGFNGWQAAAGIADSFLGGLFGLGQQSIANDVNRYIADQNLGFQRERANIEDARYADETQYNRAFAENERDYQRALQERIFEREDTAFERQASQLSNLGINPLSQQLNGANAGQAVSPSSAPTASIRSAEALHNDFQFTSNMATDFSHLFKNIQDMETGNLQQDSIREQNTYQRLLNEAQALDNAQKAERLKAELEDIKAGTYQKKSYTKTEDEIRSAKVKDLNATADRNERENVFQEKNNISDGTNQYVRMMTDIANQAQHGNEATGSLSSNVYKTASAGGSSFVKSMRIVGNALNNTIGESVRKAWNWLNDHTADSKQMQKTYGNRRR